MDSPFGGFLATDTLDSRYRDPSSASYPPSYGLAWDPTSPNNDYIPLTPTDRPLLFPATPFELYDAAAADPVLFDMSPASKMVPAPLGLSPAGPNGVSQANGNGPGGSAQSESLQGDSGISSERSTTSPTHNTTHHLTTYSYQGIPPNSWLTKPLTTDSPATLPRLHLGEFEATYPRPNQPTGYFYHASDPSTSHTLSPGLQPPDFTHPQISEGFKPHVPLSHYEHYHSYPPAHPLSHAVYPYAQPTYLSPVPHNAYTPNSPYGWTSDGTVQPSSAFGGWRQAERVRESTVAESTAGDDNDTSGGMTYQRRHSGIKAGYQPEVRDARHEEEQEEDVRPALTPETFMDDGASESSEPLRSVHEVRYTDEAEVKQTAEMKRRCFNCSSIAPPSWRKSVLHPGKILCNRCGIFERTHHRARPPSIEGIPRRVPPISAKHKRPAHLLTYPRGHGSPLQSPLAYAAGPLSAAKGFSFPPAYDQSMHATASNSSESTPSTPTGTTGMSLLHSSFLPPHRHSQIAAVSHATSPYAYAYARRYGHQPSASGSLSIRSTANIMHPPASAGLPVTQALEGAPWPGSRRHSDAVYGSISATTSAATSPE